STKVDLNHNKVRRAHDLDELAAILFPGNWKHQIVFLAIFVELKWAENQFLPTLDPITDKHGVSRRTLETVRAKMRRLGLIDHVSRFNKKHGYREGWIFSNRFANSLKTLATVYDSIRDARGNLQERKDRDLIGYLK
ncbi:hypothetical protein IIC45_01495, partial [Patescibacteria group bacterium]|nr:hypothetical protein [Patescibacteria group bacterium]